MRPSHILYPFLAAFCYGMNPILAKLGLQSSNEPVFGACIGIIAGVVVYTAYFFASGQAGQLFSLPRRAGVYFGLAGLASTLAIFSLFFCAGISARGCCRSLHLSRAARHAHPEPSGAAR